MWTVKVEVDEEGEYYIPFPDELFEKQGWNIGDTLLWTDKRDGTWSITRKETDE